jgi:hypothetical protein
LDDVVFVASDGDNYYSLKWDADIWAEDCDPCGSMSEDFESSYSIMVGTADQDSWDNTYIDGITISNNHFDSVADDEVEIYGNVMYGETEEETIFTLPDNTPEGSIIVFARDGSYTIETPHGTVKGVKGVDTGGGELNLKGCESVEMRNLDFQNVEVNIEDSKNVDLSYSRFMSDYPIEGAMLDLSGESHDVSVSHSMFNMVPPEGMPEIYSSAEIYATTEQPKPIKNVKEDVTMATSLSVTLWILVFVVALVAAVTAKRASWRSLLWPIKKLFKRAEAEGKKVEEEWNAIE